MLVMATVKTKGKGGYPEWGVPVIFGREQALHDITMDLYKKDLELEKRKRGLKAELAKLQEKNVGKEEIEAKEKEIGRIKAEIRTVRQLTNQIGELQAPSEFKPSVMKGWSIAGITASISLGVEAAVIAAIEYFQVFLELARGLGEMAFLGSMGIALAGTVGWTMDRVYDIRTGIAHNEKMVDVAVSRIFEASEIAPTSANKRKARWMFMNNIRITPATIAMGKKELWDIANEALTENRSREHAQGDFYVKVNTDGTVIYRDGNTPVVVKCIEGFAVCDSEGKPIGFANYSSNNMNLTMLQDKLSRLAHSMMGEPVKGNDPNAAKHIQRKLEGFVEADL